MDYESNHFPKPIKKIIKQSFDEPINDRAKTIILGIKENCPNLYNYIKNVKS